jgi:hypothetical protein
MSEKRPHEDDDSDKQQPALKRQRVDDADELSKLLETYEGLVDWKAKNVPSIRALLAKVWSNLPLLERHLSLSEFLDQYCPQELEPAEKPLEEQMVRIKYNVENPFSVTEATIKETLPRLAIGFLDLVNPSISITRSKHDYWEPRWKGIDYTEREDISCSGTAKDWKKLSYPFAGEWRDAVFEKDNGEEAYNYYLAHVNDDDVVAMKKETLRLWKLKRD